jgi:light-regulated signal transduction histidine kinase (bacteriophytochrome)
MTKIKPEIPHHTALLYAVFSGLWIYFSDRPLESLAPDLSTLNILQTYKGMYFVVVTTILLFLILRVRINKLQIVQDKIVKLNEELEERVRQRTEALEQANWELEAFAYSVSHDLRAPLRAINGFSKILQTEHSDALPVDAQDLLNDILNNTRHMSLLIDDLMELSRSSRKEMIKDTVDIVELFHQCFDDLMRHNERQDIRLTIHDLPDTYGDYTLLKQIVVNLLSNAIKFTGKCAAPEITIDGRIENGQCVYSVIDNGVGFDPRYKDKLFGVFQRLHRTNEFEGTGVGLAIIKRIAERHGGTLWADSEVDKGAQFYFSIPIHNGGHHGSTSID